MMKLRMLVIVLMTGLMSINAQAQITRSVDGSAMMNGYMNVFELPENGGGFAFGSSWGVPDLSAYFTNSNYEVTLVPNSIGDASEYWYQGGGGPGAPGNKIMEALVYNETTDTYGGQLLTFTGTVIANTLTSNHTVVAYIRDFAPDYSSNDSQSVPLTNGAFSVSMFVSGDPGRHVQYGFAMTGPNVWVTDLAPFGSMVIEVSDDTTAPSVPSFETGPVATGDNSISMTATEVTDNLFDVEYYFTCTNNAAFDSGWQSDRTYEVLGLDTGTEYTFTVKARDTHPNQNETAESAPASATTTLTDNDPPTPAPTFALAPAAITPVSMAMESTVANDPGGVEYFFDCNDDAFDSGWQSGTAYEVEGMNPETEYTFTVQARDLSSQTNLTAASSGSSDTTPELIKFMRNSLQAYTGITSNLATRALIGADSLDYGSVEDIYGAISFGTNGATFGTVDGGAWGRNILRTVATDYNVSSFEAYATFEFGGGGDQAAFIGMGMGIVSPVDPSDNYGVPGLNLRGVNEIVAEMKTPESAGPKNCNLLKIIDGYQQDQQTDPVAITDTLRAKLAYDAAANTVTVSIDTNYMGGAFVEDVPLGSWVATNTPGVSMWDGIPVRVYAGGGEGMVVSDLEIITPVPSEGIDLAAITPVSGGFEITWDAAGGLTYDLQYKTDLVADPTWTLDPSPGCTSIFAPVDGTISVTSTVGTTEAYYQLLTK